MRTRVLAVTGLLAAAGAGWLWWHGRSHPVAPGDRSAVITDGGYASALKSSAAKAGAAAASKSATLNTNKLALRLSNTTNSIGQLEKAPHALLLANAFIDTDKPLDLHIPPQLRATGDPGAYIVQARGRTDARFRNTLAAAGARIVSYIPNNAYLVRIPAKGAGELAASPAVQAVLPYEPYYKVQAPLLKLAVNQQPLPPGMALTLGLFAMDAAAADALVEKLGAKIIGHDRSPFGPVVRVLAPPDWLALAQSPAVQIVEPARVREPANDLSRVTVGVSENTLTNADYLNLYGSNVLVAVNDTGIDAKHPDLAGRVAGLNPIDLVDTNGHGTFVAGVIASSGMSSTNPVDVGAFAEGSQPGADFRGKAPLADLFSLRSYHSDYAMQTNAALIGALISNNSWDYGASEYDLAAASYDAATRDALPFTTGSQPVLFVFAAGNSGGGDNDGQGGSADTILSPGTAKNVITVGALEQYRNITNIVTDANSNTSAYWQPQTDSGNQVAFYSSRGNVGVGTEGSYGRFKPDLVSPGTFVVSTRSSQWDTNAYYNVTNDLNTTYTYQIVDTNGLVYYNVAVPPNAVAVNITISPNKNSPVPFPPDLLLYARQASFPTTNTYDILTAKDGLSIPPDSGGAITGIQAIQGTGFSFAVGSTNSFAVNYNLSVDVLTTNNLGNLEIVLEQMNETLAPYYRYESGTSIAAADASGVLALIEDYFTNQFQPSYIPSPALMKALLINGCRSVANYSYALTNGINFQGWGLDNIQACVPAGGLFDQADGSTEGSSFFVDQSPTNALATGDSHTYLVTINTNADSLAQYLQLEATLVWTDPPGDPASAIKLVNNLDLVITNLDTGDVYFGNDISPGVGYNVPWNTNGPPNLDSINNVENIRFDPGQSGQFLAGHYSVTVVGRDVNVNAVTAQTNNAAGLYAPNIVQDYALVISVGEGEQTNAFTVADGGVAVNPVGDQTITVVTTTNAPLFNQFAGASSPLLGTNTLPLGTQTIWGPNGQVTLGMTNQWHFYVVTNSGPGADFTNAAFITFDATTLSIPRMGVYEDTVANATKPEADIDLFVSQDPTITNLNPVAISNCLAATSAGGVGDGGASLTQGGTEFVFFTNSAPGQVYYVGVKSEDQMGAEYAFLPVFTETPFSSLTPNGDQLVHGLLLPQNIPDGDNAHPGVTNIFALAIMPMQVEKVTVTNLDEHQNFGDLFGTLTFSGQHVVLNNHDGFGNTFGAQPIVYDDSRNRPFGTTNSDGPGSLVNFRAMSALGPWILTEMDNSLTMTGRVTRFDLLIQPHRDLKEPGVIVAVPPGGWFVDFVDVPAGYTNLTFNGTNVTLPTPGLPPIQMYEKFGNDPTLTDYDQRADLTNGPTPPGPGNSISIGPPLAMGRYFVGLYNPGTISQNVFISAVLGVNATVNDQFTYSTNNSPLLDDAVTNSSIFVSATQTVASVNVGMVVNHPRISDLMFTLVSPTGQRVLLMENRGGGSSNIGHLTYITNFFGTTASGGASGDTNVIPLTKNSGVLIVDYDFMPEPDNMDVYYDGVNIFHSGLVSFTGTFTIPYGPGLSTNLVIVMDGPGSGAVATNSLWSYTPRVVQEDYNYLTFTDDTNLTQVPIKYAIPPFDVEDPGTNYTFSDFELATNGDYLGLTNIYDAFGGWTVPTNLVSITTIETNGQLVLVTNVLDLTSNLVSVVADPWTAQNGSNYLALGRGTITRTLPFTIGRKYQVAYDYRGPGIAGWWRGEGNATDSSDPENNGNNGALVGRFNFPAGVVGQALQFEDPGNTYQFAATNTYVQIPASATLNVGTNGGFTVEGWINPTNLSRPQPLVEWLAKVPTNTTDTNLTIVQGPMLSPVTGHFYYLVATTNWFTSEAWAQQLGRLGGHLATIETANEENWIYDTFTAYGTLNRDLWIGLNDAAVAGTFVWSGGSTNVPYTNWAPGQPGNACSTDRFVAIMGPTNAYPGLWNLEGNNRQTCGVPPTLPIYGVVEVDDIPTNGVQFWISGTNGTPETNYLQGCLYANIVDTNYVSHEIFSAPGLLQSNVYQHVALTYNTNSGIAALYLNGTNVATTNLGVFVPKTDGDVLLGWDMSRYTNNYYAGKMDEMSIYSRPLSLAEISSIYQISVPSTNGIGNTNGLIGKFDPAIFPPLSLAKFQVSLGSTKDTLYADNARWQINGFTFTAETNSLPLTFTGLEPGVLLDNMSISETPLGNLYYLPEQALAALNGSSAYGDWTLQVWDNRAGAYLTNLSQVVTWQLTFTLVTNAVVSASLPPETPVTTTVPSGQIVYYSVTVPEWAHYATNVLVSSDQPVDVYFNQTNPPTGSNPNDYTLLANVTSGSGVPILVTNATPSLQEQPLLTNQTYYLGVKNLGIHSATVNLEVDYDITALTNGVPFTSTLNTNDYNTVRYFQFDVSSNAYEATFQLLKLSGNADLVVRKGAPLPDLTSSDYGSFNVRTADENIYLLTNSAPVPLSAGRWYLGVFKRDSGLVNYSVLAKELDTNSPPTMPVVISLTNGVPFTWTAGPGAALTNFFRFHVTNSIVGGTNYPVQGLRFELYGETGNGDLTVQTNALPLAPPFFQTSQNGYGSPELVLVYTNSALTNLAADWYLGVPNREVTNINYTIIAVTQTNLYFPAFPDAYGAGGGASGGRFGDVYHVTTTADSGAGSLRDAIYSATTNRTVVFDIDGTIYLASPLVITNSYLTIAGQTAPGGGITVAGQMTTVRSAHDVVIRDVRFRSGTASGPVVVWSNGFEEGGNGPSAGQYFSGGWLDDFGTIDMLSTGNFGSAAYEGTHYIDLDGSSAGGISTNIATIPGQVYMLHFAYARNPDSILGALGQPPSIPQATVSINGQQLTTVTANYNNTWSALNWQTVSYLFTAPSASTHLAFHSLDAASSISGVLLDGISLITNSVVYDSFQGTAGISYTQNQAVNGWFVITNQTSVVTDPTNSYVGHSNFLALANGIISNSVPTVPGQTYTLSLVYRGPGIAAWWRGENGYLDSVNGNTGTPENGGPGFMTGEVGQAFNFNGANNFVLVNPASTALTSGLGNGFTFDGWINPAFIPTSASQDMILFRYENHLPTYSGSDIGMECAIHDSTLTGAPGGCLYANVKDTLNNNHTLTSPASLLVAGTWQHIALTYDKASGIAAFYLNGVLVTQVSSGSFTPSTTFTNLLFGATTFFASINAPNNPFAGGVDELCFYDRALSISEIKAIYDKGSAGKFDPVVLASSPAQSLAEANVSIPGVATKNLLGNNTNWQTYTTTFTASGAATPVVISGVEPGMLLDSLSLAPVGASGGLGGSLQFNAVSNVIADHISTSWSTNEDLSVLSSTNVTVQWSIMADSLYSSNYPGIGSLLRYGNGTLSFHHNLYADDYTGSPRFGDNLTLDFVNNVIYNWGGRSGLAGGTNDFDYSTAGCTNQLNYVCNYLIGGPDTAIFAANNYNITNIAFFGGVTNVMAANWIFQTNNFIDSDNNGILNGSDTGWGMFTNQYTRFGRAFPTPPVPVDEAFMAYERVLAFAGVDLTQRDPVDTNIVTNVRYQTGRIISAPGALPALVSRLPFLDTDQDGIPDFWENTFTPNLLYVPSNKNDRDGDGYTDLEEYNNWLAVPHALTVTNTPVGVDLYQLCGESGHLAFFLTNSIHGLVYLTNVLGSVSNTSPVWSNTIAIFTPTNSAAGGTNYSGYASFDFYVTNFDTAAYFGPVKVSVIVSAVPIAINSNMPPVITPLTSGVSSDPTNYGGSQFYSIVVTTNDYGALFELDDPTGPMAMVVGKEYDPSLSHYDYYTNAPPPPGNQEIAVFTNSTPVPLSPGTWIMAAVNESGSNVVYTAKITLLQKVYPPVFLYPTNTDVFTNIETTPLTINCVAVDTNAPPLPLSFALVNGPQGLVLTNGVIYWTPSETNGPSTNSVAVSVSNGPFSVTNSFTIIVEESNLPPVLPVIPNQLVTLPGGQLVVTNTATDPDFPPNPLGYTLTSTVTGANTPVIDANGVITWTPALDQIGTNYLFTTVVADTNPWAVNAQSLSATNHFYVTVLPPLPPGEPETNVVSPNSIKWFAVDVPTNAIYATNTLLFATLPVNLWFSTNLPPTITNAADTELLVNATNGLVVLSTNLATAPTNIVPGGTYYLGVQNTSSTAITNALRVDFGFATPWPVLPLIPVQIVTAGDTLVVTNTATDSAPGATLVYNLVDPPAGAVISTGGIITWPTTIPTNVVITTVVTDTHANLSATNSFAVIVLPGLVIEQPHTNIIVPNGINWFSVKVPANADQATNTLLFATAPVNLWFSLTATITNAADFELLTNSLGGSHVINTTSVPRLVPGSTYYLGVENPNNFAVTNAVKVNFHLMPASFSIFSIAQTNIGGSNGFLITWFAPTNDQFHLQWTPSLAPAAWTNFNGVISDVATAPTNGLFQFFDDGSQTGGFGPTRFYRLLLLTSPTNTAPFFLFTPAPLTAITNTPFVFTNTAKDWDIPSQTLIYSVTSTLAGTNLTINPTNGVIAWTPTAAQLGQTNFITTTVTDNGVPAKSMTNLIAVVVTAQTVPPFSSITIVTNGVKFTWTAPANDQFQIQWTTNLAPVDWHLFPDIITSPTGNFSFVDTNMPLLMMKFYQLILLP